MQLHFIFQNSLYSLEASSDITIRDLKALLEIETQIPTQFQEIRYNGRILAQEDKSLQDYRITEESCMLSIKRRHTPPTPDSKKSEIPHSQPENAITQTPFDVERHRRACPGTRAPCRAGQAVAARARAAAHRSGHAVPRAVAARGAGHVRRRDPGAGLITGIGRVTGRECVIVANDATVKGGTYFPAHGEEASARAGDRAREPAALHLSGRFRRRQPAAPGPRSSPTAIISAASSTTRPTCPPPASPQIAVVMGSCTAGGAYVPAMSDETHHRAQPGHHFSRRPAAGEGRDRRGGERGRARRRRRPYAPLRRRRLLCRRRRPCAGDVPPHRRPSQRRRRRSISRWRAARSRLRSRGALRAGPDRSAQGPTTSATSSRGWSTAPNSTSSRRSTAPRW